MKKLNTLLKTIVCTGFFGMLLSATTANADSNFYMTGKYKVHVTSGDNTLNCRSAATANSRIVKVLNQGTYINVTDVVGSSRPWLKIDRGCYVRGHANYLKKIGNPSPSNQVSSSHHDDYDSNYYMTGNYKITLSNGSRSLNCRSKPNTKSAIRTKFYKGKQVKVTDVVGHSNPWLKTSQGCYIRGHANYITYQGR